MKKRFLSILLTLCMAFTLMPATAFAEGAEDSKCGDDLTWNNVGNTLTISGTGDMYVYENRGSNRAPWRLSQAHLSLKAINIADGVTSIGNYAFNGCSGDASISIPSSVTSIGVGAFSSFQGLKSITIPDSVTSIGVFAFASCSQLENVTLPKNLTQIERNLFDHCTSLTSVTIPNGVTSIGRLAFQNTAISNIVIPTSVTNIGIGAFEDCGSLQNVYYPGSKSQWDKVNKERDWAKGSNLSIHCLEHVGAKAPTCTDAGNSEYWYYTNTNPIQYFSDSGATTRISAPITTSATGHSIEHIPAKAATQTETGNIEHWHCRVCNNYFSDEDGKNTIDVKDTIIPKLPPEIIDGKDQSLTEGERKELIFRSNAAYSDFDRVELDGNTVEAQNYTVRDGSTIVTLNSNYVATLPVGRHTLGIVSQSGTATTTITVNAKAAVVDDPQTEETQADDGNNKTDDPTKDTNLPQADDDNNVPDKGTKDANLPQTDDGKNVSDNRMTDINASQADDDNNVRDDRMKDGYLPQTGDSSYALLWIVLLLVSGAVLAVFACHKRNKAYCLSVNRVVTRRRRSKTRRLK